jgi:EF-hand domain pair
VWYHNTLNVSKRKAFLAIAKSTAAGGSANAMAEDRWTQERGLSFKVSICRLGVATGLLLAGAAFALAQSAAGGPEIWDANHDGVYTCDEWKSYLGRIFTLADRNRDGVLDQSEFATVRKAGGVLAEADFGYFDENQDGKITRNEFVSKPSEFILRYDRNGDCRVTPDEIKAGGTPKQVGPPVRERDRFHPN